MIPPHCRNLGIGTAHFRINCLWKQLLKSMYVLHTLVQGKTSHSKFFAYLLYSQYPILNAQMRKPSRTSQCYKKVGICKVNRNQRLFCTMYIRAAKNFSNDVVTRILMRCMLELDLQKKEAKEAILYSYILHVRSFK